MEFKGIVSSLVISDLASVHPYFALPVDGAEVQDHVFPVPFGRKGETAAIPERMPAVEAAGHAGKRRLYAERHQDVTVRVRHRLFRLFSYGVIP